LTTSVGNSPGKPRVGIAPPGDSMRAATKNLYLAAIDVWRRSGAEVIDAPLPRAFREVGASEFTALLYEFKSAIDAYLGALAPQQTAVRSLTELIEFNRRNADRELHRFGQEIFEMAVTKGPLTDKPYLDAVAELNKRVDAEGLDQLFRSLRVDVLVAPGAGPPGLSDPILGDRNDTGGSGLGSAAAIAGYPSLTLPIGLIKDLPMGMTLVAPRHAEDRLLRIASSFVCTRNLRVPPPLVRR
jgi:amidase